MELKMDTIICRTSMNKPSSTVASAFGLSTECCAVGATDRPRPRDGPPRVLTCPRTLASVSTTNRE